MTTDTITPEESRNFRRLRCAFGWMTVVAFGTIPLGSYEPTVALSQSLVFQIFGAVYFAAYCIVGITVCSWVCPRCGNHYALVSPKTFGGFFWPWLDHCSHCQAKLATP